MLLYRPVNQAELDLIIDSQWLRFPPRLAGQPIFYPVLNEAYAEQITREWNVPTYGIGHVLRFEVEDEYLAKVSELLKERAVFVSDMTEDNFYFTPPTEFDEKTIKKKWKENTPDIIKELIQEFEKINEFNAENVEISFKQYLADKEIGMGAVLPNFRVLVTGKGMGPSMFQIAAILGKEETISRLSQGLQKVQNS